MGGVDTVPHGEHSTARCPNLPGHTPLLPGLKNPPRPVDATSTPETNLRTYVQGPDGRDGVWCLSLDIGSATLAAVLRRVSPRLGISCPALSVGLLEALQQPVGEGVLTVQECPNRYST